MLVHGGGFKSSAQFDTCWVESFLNDIFSAGALPSV